MSNEPDIPGDLRDLLRKGRVAQRDLLAKTCVVEIGDLMLPKVRWGSLRLGRFRFWLPPTEGEQVLVACPEGDSAQAIIVLSLACNQFPDPSSEDALWVEVDDGSRFSYEPESHALSVILCDGGKVVMTAPAGFELTGNVKVTGDLDLSGKATVAGDVIAQGDVKAGAISLKTHKTKGVQPGAGLSGDPQ